MENSHLDFDDDTEVSFSCMANGQLQNFPTQPCLSTDPNFEFHSSHSMSPSPADLLFFDGHLLPCSYPINNPTKNSRSSPTSNTASRSNSLSSSDCTSGSSGGGSARRCLRKGGERVPAAEPKRVTFQLSSVVDGGWQSPEPSLATTNSMRSGSGRWYRAVVGGGEARGRKEAGKQQRGLFGRIVTACRECHALEPSKVVDNSNNKIIAT